MSSFFSAVIHIPTRPFKELPAYQSAQNTDPTDSPPAPASNNIVSFISLLSVNCIFRPPALTSERNKTLNTRFPLLHICPMKNWTEVLYCCTLNSTCFIQRRRQHCKALMCQTRLSGFVCCKYLNISIDIPPGPAPGEHAARRWKAGARQLLCRYDADWQLGLCCFEPPGRKKKTKKKNCCQFFTFSPFLLFQAEGLFCEYEPLSWWQ